jgi:hypothetical protein
MKKHPLQRNVEGGCCVIKFYKWGQYFLIIKEEFRQG